MLIALYTYIVASNEKRGKMKTYSSIEELIEDSLQVYTGMVYLYHGIEYKHDIDESLRYEGCYSIRNLKKKVIAFIHNGKFYVTPFTNGAYLILIKSHFESRGFDVPFSDCDLPKDIEEFKKWMQLISEARIDKVAFFEFQCIKWCEEHGIYQINQSVLDQCFRIPESGVEYSCPYYNDIFYPFIPVENNLDCFDFESTNLLGKFSYNNGIVVFVYCNGHTYVSKGLEILDILRDSGYEGKGLFVPFSRDEVIIDPDLKARWDEVCCKR